MSIKAVSSTLGRPKPGLAGYSWNGDPGKSEAARTATARREPLGSPVVRARQRVERVRRFTELVLGGAHWRQAAQDPEVGVEVKTARNYWNALPPEVRAEAERAAQRLAEQGAQA